MMIGGINRGSQFDRPHAPSRRSAPMSETRNAPMRTPQSGQSRGSTLNSGQKGAKASLIGNHDFHLAYRGGTIYDDTMIKCIEGEIIPMRSIEGKSGQMAKMLTPKEIALEWDCTAKTLRKFLRKDEKAISLNGGDTPGKGGRWGIPANSLKTMQKRFDAWNAAKAPKGEDEVEAPSTPESPIAPE